MKILLIEDENKTAAYLKKGLMENGFVVDVASEGETGLHFALEFAYDLIILDIMLPRRDGWSLLTHLRQQGKDMPVIFLTARDAIAERVKGLELGADDYLIKPFAFSELLARIRSILRRHVKQGTDPLRLDDLALDPLRRTVTRGPDRLDLTPREFMLLELFMQHPGEVLSRTFIAERVWDMNFDSDTNTVDVAVRRLRKKVDDPFAEKYIHTIRGMGYVLEKRA